MKRPSFRTGLAGVVLGALGFVAFGASPGSLPPLAQVHVAWSLPGPSASNDEARAILAGAPLWLSQPVAPAAGVEREVPPPRLVGIIEGAARQRLAILQWEDGRRQRFAVGETIPGEGHLRAIGVTVASWQRADGRLVEARLFLHQDPEAITPEGPN